MESTKTKIRQVPEDRIKTIMTATIVDSSLSPTNQMQQLINEISRGIAEKLIEFHKISTWDAGFGRIGYQSSFEIIVPTTPDSVCQNNSVLSSHSSKPA